MQARRMSFYGCYQGTPPIRQRRKREKRTPKMKLDLLEAG